MNASVPFSINGSVSKPVSFQDDTDSEPLLTKLSEEIASYSQTCGVARNPYSPMEEQPANVILGTSAGDFITLPQHPQPALSTKYQPGLRLQVGDASSGLRPGGAHDSFKQESSMPDSCQSTVRKPRKRSSEDAVSSGIRHGEPESATIWMASSKRGRSYTTAQCAGPNGNGDASAALGSNFFEGFNPDARPRIHGVSQRSSSFENQESSPTRPMYSSGWSSMQNVRSNSTDALVMPLFSQNFQEFTRSPATSIAGSTSALLRGADLDYSSDRGTIRKRRNSSSRSTETSGQNGHLSLKIGPSSQGSRDGLSHHVRGFVESVGVVLASRESEDCPRQLRDEFEAHAAALEHRSSVASMQASQTARERRQQTLAAANASLGARAPSSQFHAAGATRHKSANRYSTEEWPAEEEEDTLAAISKVTVKSPDGTVSLSRGPDSGTPSLLANDGVDVVHAVNAHRRVSREAGAPPGPGFDNQSYEDHQVEAYIANAAVTSPVSRRSLKAGGNGNPPRANTPTSGSSTETVSSGMTDNATGGDVTRSASINLKALAQFLSNPPPRESPPRPLSPATSQKYTNRNGFYGSSRFSFSQSNMCMDSIPKFCFSNMGAHLEVECLTDVETTSGNLLNEIESGKMFWLDVYNVTSNDMFLLQEVFGIHPLTCEDIMTRDTREKCETFPNYVLVVLRVMAPSWESLAAAAFGNVYILLFENFVLTFHQDNVISRESINRRIMFRSSVGKLTTADWILYSILDEAVDACVIAIRALELEVDAIGELTIILTQSDQTDLLRRVGRARRLANLFKNMLVGKSEILKPLTTRAAAGVVEFVRSETAVYLRDVLDHVIGMFQSLEASRDALNQAHSNYLAQISIEITVLSNKTNQVMKKLTVATVFIMPLTLVTGIMGMNVRVPGQVGEEDELDFDDLSWFLAIMGGMVILCVIMYFAMKRLNWFD